MEANLILHAIAVCQVRQLRALLDWRVLLQQWQLCQLAEPAKIERILIPYRALLIPQVFCQDEAVGCEFHRVISHDVPVGIDRVTHSRPVGIDRILTAKLRRYRTKYDQANKSNS